MRKEVHVAWLDDNVGTPRITSLQKKVKVCIEKKGYKPEVHPFSTFDDALKFLREHKHCDFFVTDLKLDSEKNGFQYRNEIRQVNGYRQFVLLYSNNSMETIREEVSRDIKDTASSNLDCANFAFVSINPTEEPSDSDWQAIVEAALCSWDELNALRGEVVCEHAELDIKLKEIVGDIGDYSTRIAEYKRQVFRRYRHIWGTDDEKIFTEWKQMRDIRNACAHADAIQTGAKGPYLHWYPSNGDYINIYEKDINEQRTNLVNFKTRVEKFMQTHNL